MSGCRIAVSGLVRRVDEFDRTGVNSGYVAAVLEAGGLPLILSPLIGAERAAEALVGCDGLLLTGGADLDPVRYGEAPSRSLRAVEPERDAFEFALLTTARARGLPILAICRGMQLVNVAAGGTLWQDLPTDRPGPVAHEQSTPSTSPAHLVQIEAGTRAAGLLGSTSIQTNSTHHQAVRDLGAGLRATGWADDGSIEALESSNAGEWLVAVQWHPERGSAGLPDKELFRGFVAAAVERRYASNPSPR